MAEIFASSSRVLTGGLELWESTPLLKGCLESGYGVVPLVKYTRYPCAGLSSSLDNETGLDLPGMNIRPVSGRVTADCFALGYFVWAVLISNLARIGYEEKNMYMAAYDWRISFQNIEEHMVIETPLLLENIRRWTLHFSYTARWLYTVL